MKRLFTGLRWVAFNFGLAALAWFSVIEGVEGAARLLKFIWWACAVLLLLGVSLLPEVRKEAVKRGYPVPKWLGAIVNLLMIGFFVYHGWWWTAAAVILAATAEAVLFTAPKETKLPSKDAS